MSGDVARLLDALGLRPVERLSLNWREVGGPFRSVVLPVAEVPAAVARWHGRADVWLGAQPVRPGTTGRGLSSDVVAVVGLYADLDVKDGGLSSWDDAAAVVDTLAAVLGADPVAVVRTGHGLQPRWALDPRLPAGEHGQAVLRRWGRLVARVAAEVDGHVDGVYDLARVLRAPGSVNVGKGDPVPVVVDWTGGDPVAPERLVEALDAAGVPTLAGDEVLTTARLGQAVDVDAAVAGLPEVPVPCAYAAAAVAGMLAEPLTERHPWLVRCAVRVVELARKGCADARTDLPRVVDRFAAAVAADPTRPGDPVAEVQAVLAHALDPARTFTDAAPCDHPRQNDGNAAWPSPAVEVPAVKPLDLDTAHATFARWLGADYDLVALDAVLAAAAVERLDGDPVWLLLLSGSGNAKTETASALVGAGARVTSTIASEGALLSATSRRERGKDATGGLLRAIGDRGLLVVKDVTSILSANRDTRAAVLAALREVYDGRWERNVGTDGGRTLTWTGRLVVVGAVTTAWDSAHGVVAAMGDRFAVVRVDSHQGRVASGRQALRNVGSETAMRADLADAVAGVTAGLDPTRAVLDDDAVERLLAAADLVTLARTGVERDHQGNVVDAHAPEMPTRFAKMLGQLVRGALALGMTRDRALEVALRVAGDSVPPLRLDVLADVAAHPGARTSEVTRRVQRPRSTVDRVLQELHLLRLLVVDEGGGTGWCYRLADTVDGDTLRDVVTRNVTTPGYWGKGKAPGPADTVRLDTDKPGDAPGPRRVAPVCPVCAHRVDSVGHAERCAS